MRFAHISDLHIGKKLREASLEEDQRHILCRIVDIVRNEEVDAVLIAGDIYDTTTPNTESVSMLDDFLTDLIGTGVKVFMIAGNHDSPERLGFGNRILREGGLYVSGTYSGHLDVFPVGDVDVCLLPFIKPIHARRMYPDETIESYEDAVRTTIAHTDLAPGRRRILVTHQFITANGTGPERSESELASVGGTDAIDVSVFDGFDYVALGHIHAPQSVGRRTVRYCGTPLKYSLSEKDQEKSVTIVDVGDDVEIRTIPLKPLRGMREIRGPLQALIDAGKNDPDRDDFIYVKLEGDAYDALSRLREIYPNVLSIDTADEGWDTDWTLPEGDDWHMDLLSSFAEFYRTARGVELTEGQKKILDELREGE